MSSMQVDSTSSARVGVEGERRRRRNPVPAPTDVSTAAPAAAEIVEDTNPHRVHFGRRFQEAFLNTIHTTFKDKDPNADTVTAAELKSQFEAVVKEKVDQAVAPLQPPSEDDFKARITTVLESSAMLQSINRKLDTMFGADGQGQMSMRDLMERALHWREDETASKMHNIDVATRKIVQALSKVKKMDEKLNASAKELFTVSINRIAEESRLILSLVDVWKNGNPRAFERYKEQFEASERNTQDQLSQIIEKLHDKQINVGKEQLEQFQKQVYDDILQELRTAGQDRREESNNWTQRLDAVSAEIKEKIQTTFQQNATEKDEILRNVQNGVNTLQAQGNQFHVEHKAIYDQQLLLMQGLEIAHTNQTKGIEKGFEYQEHLSQQLQQGFGTQNEQLQKMKSIMDKETTQLLDIMTQLLIIPFNADFGAVADNDTKTFNDIRNEITNNIDLLKQDILYTTAVDTFKKYCLRIHCILSTLKFSLFAFTHFPYNRLLSTEISLYMAETSCTQIQYLRLLCDQHREYTNKRFSNDERALAIFQRQMGDLYSIFNQFRLSYQQNNQGIPLQELSENLERRRFESQIVDADKFIINANDTVIADADDEFFESPTEMNARNPLNADVCRGSFELHPNGVHLVPCAQPAAQKDRFCIYHSSRLSQM